MNTGSCPVLNYFCKTGNDVCIFASMSPSHATKATEMDRVASAETWQLTPEHGSCWSLVVGGLGCCSHTSFRYSIGLRSQDFYWCFQAFIEMWYKSNCSMYVMFPEEEKYIYAMYMGVCWWKGMQSYFVSGYIFIPDQESRDKASILPS